MDRIWGYDAAVDTGTVTVHVRRLREKIEDDPSSPRFLETVWGVGYRFARVTELAVIVALASARRSASLAVLALHLLPTVKAAARGPRACSPSFSRWRPFSLSGWVMFHMGADLKILAVASASATAARRSRIAPGPVDLAANRPAPRRPRHGSPRAISPPAPPRADRASSPSWARPSTRWRATSSSCSTPGASSSPGQATISERRSPPCRRCSRRSRTGSPRRTTICPSCASQVRAPRDARRGPVRAGADRRGPAHRRATRDLDRQRGRVLLARARAGGAAPSTCDSRPASKRPRARCAHPRRSSACCSTC